MDSINFYLPDHWGSINADADISLYENTWNNYGYQGIFEFNLRKKIKYAIRASQNLYICRIDGTMKKRHELRSIYSRDDKCFSRLPNNIYISFPNKALCLSLLLNCPLEFRKEISERLCFNFGEGTAFTEFKCASHQYDLSILRYRSEEDFLEEMKECRKLIFFEQDLNSLLETYEVKIQ
ncbi:MAG: hypothetical protein K2H01_01925 [Ruminococcus sp.]|nr:hypothetical protein [Ruminococcus sp.]